MFIANFCFTFGGFAPFMSGQQLHVLPLVFGACVMLETENGADHLHKRQNSKQVPELRAFHASTNGRRK